MTDKELRRLSRAELLELLLIQTKETERLRVRLENARQQLENREIRIRDSGNLAEAVLAVNGVIDAANAAAEQYLENIARMEAETQARCRQMLEEAELEAQRIRNAAVAEVKRGAENSENGLQDLLGEVMDLIGE